MLRNSIARSGSFFLGMMLFIRVASAANFSVLYNFQGPPNDGKGPVGSMVAIGGNLYGLTSIGGANNGGTIFSFDPATNVETPLYSLKGVPTDTLVPSTTDPNLLYGQSYGIFSFDATTGTVSTVFAPDTVSPSASPQQVGNLLYTYNVAGFVSAYNLSTGSLTPLASVGGSGTLTPGNGLLYGVGDSGTNGPTFLFSFNPSTNVVTPLYTFTGDGPVPQLTISGNTIYGLTGSALFSYGLDTGTFNALLSLTPSTTGADSYGGVILDGTTLYGTQTDVTPGSAGGNIFSYDLSTGTYTILHQFAPGTQSAPDPEGDYPIGDLTLVGNTLYGTAQQGGLYGDGTIFSVTVPEPASVGIMVIAGAGLLARRRSR